MNEFDDSGVGTAFGAAQANSTGHGETDHGRHRNGDQRARERGHNNRGSRGNHPAQDRQAVLVDARFWAWLNNAEAGACNTEQVRDSLHELVHQQGGKAVRALWYTDQDNDRSVPGLQVRRVPSNAQDQGVTMLRAMAQDLAALAEHRGVDRVLLVSDDDRLLLALDEAQRRGLMIDMLVDRDSQDLQALSEDEPHWATLLFQADRLVVLGGAESSARGHRARQNAFPESRAVRREPPSAEASGIIEDEVLKWWDDEAPEQRDTWRQEVQAARGIPQELDRQLLLRISRRLGQALSPAEKSAMRYQVRVQVLGAEGASAAAGSPGLMRPPEDA